MAKKKLLSGDGWSFEPAAEAAPLEAVSLPPERQRATIALEKKPRGKTATRVSGLVLSAADRARLAADLKKRCGSGGGHDADWIEVQGDHRDAMRAYLAGLGYRVK